MLEAAGNALSQMFKPSLRAVLFKAIGLALILIVLAGIGLHRLLAALAERGAAWGENLYGPTPVASWELLVWLLSVMAGLGIITGALFLMPAVTAFVGSFFVDEIAEQVERAHYLAEPPGRALPFFRALAEGGKTALIALAVYVCALPFVLFAGLGFVVMFVASAYLLGREYFELAAMRFRPRAEAKAMRRRHAGYIFAAGLPIALFVAIPVLNLATPLFAMAYMVHIHKRLSGKRTELIEPRGVRS